MPHIRGARYHPMDTGKDRALAPDAQEPHPAGELLLPGELEARIEAFVAHYNHLRYHESIDNLTPADVYLGRGQTILLERERIKRKTIQHRRLHHKTHAA
jgi:putative transposase